MKSNPFPKTIVDEACGLEFTNDRFRDWEAGYKACLSDLKKQTYQFQKNKKHQKQTRYPGELIY